MNTWFDIQSSLSKMTLKRRKLIFSRFVKDNPNWKSRTIKALGRVVVHLERQVDVCGEFDLRKQALNRSVRHYRYYVTKHNYCKKAKHEKDILDKS